MNTRKTTSLLLTLALLCAALPGITLAEETRTITVNASATVVAEPDMGTIRFGVVTNAREVAAASSANAAEMERLTRALTQAGIDEKDLSTSGYYVGPVYDYTAQDEDGAYRLKGYEVSNTLSVTLRDITRAGAIIDLALANGANNCSGITFSSSHAQEAADQALLAAIAEGKRKAALIAQGCGGQLGDLQSVTEAASPVGVVVNAKRALGEEAATDSDTQIFSDSVTFNATVQMVFLLNP